MIKEMQTPYIHIFFYVGRILGIGYSIDSQNYQVFRIKGYCWTLSSAFPLPSAWPVSLDVQWNVIYYMYIRCIIYTLLHAYQKYSCHLFHTAVTYYWQVGLLNPHTGEFSHPQSDHVSNFEQAVNMSFISGRSITVQDPNSKKLYYLNDALKKYIVRAENGE